MAEGVLGGSDGFTNTISPISYQTPPALSNSSWFDTVTGDSSGVILPYTDDISDDDLLDSGQPDPNLTPGLSPTADCRSMKNVNMPGSDQSRRANCSITVETPVLEGSNGRPVGILPDVQVIGKHDHGSLSQTAALVTDAAASAGNRNRLGQTAVSEHGVSVRDSQCPHPQHRSTHCHMGSVGSSDKLARNQLITVVVLCLLFMAGEAIGGALSNSLALFTDVLHLGSDLISFIISLLAIYLSTKPATKKMSFGYHRAEVLGAVFSVFIIWLVSGVLCYMAVERIIHEHYKDVKADEMLITATIGVVFNLIMGFVLHSERCCKFGSAHRSFGHNHSHGSGHGHMTQRNRSEYQPLHQVLDESTEVDEHEDSHEFHETNHRHKNINVRAAFIHVVGDIIQSLGVFVAALIIKFTSDDRFRLADPICTFLFSLLVLITTIAVLRDTLLVMMEGVPRDINYESLKQELFSIEGVEMVHSLHIWSLTIDKNALSVHLAVGETTDNDVVLSTATSKMQRNHNISHVTIQVEKYDREIMSSCEQCQEPKK
ncbi:zinc transporter 2-like [Haliotis rufescens]|uniref:zinc transporter 2-like n=1 Tax=Haliotis rufescens TaxID=6454 RepID=UPI00201FA08D|nr:zinc transporter 2-like [Haliotis rufescens]